MIISKITGGLGNQMFQYAVGRALSLEKGVSLFIDTSSFTGTRKSDSWPFTLDLFPIQARVASGEEISQFQPRMLPLQKLLKLLGRRVVFPQNYIAEPCFQYWQGINKAPSHCYLEGYWQTARYFEKYAEIIKSDFSFPEITEAANIKYQGDIQEHPQSVSVHIRRGDYLTASGTHLCPLSYYEKALTEMNSTLTDPHYFFFSDDPDWVRENFSFPHMTVVTGNHGENSFRDMQLMSLCRHHIIANSTFSWWAAWLSMGSGVTIAPQKWFAGEERLTGDLYCPDWIQL